MPRGRTRRHVGSLRVRPRRRKTTSPRGKTILSCAPTRRWRVVVVESRESRGISFAPCRVSPLFLSVRSRRSHAPVRHAHDTNRVRALPVRPSERDEKISGGAAKGHETETFLPNRLRLSRARSRVYHAPVILPARAAASRACASPVARLCYLPRPRCTSAFRSRTPRVPSVAPAVSPSSTVRSTAAPTCQTRAAPRPPSRFHPRLQTRAGIDRRRRRRRVPRVGTAPR